MVSRYSLASIAYPEFQFHYRLPRYRLPVLSLPVEKIREPCEEIQSSNRIFGPVSLVRVVHHTHVHKSCSWYSRVCLIPGLATWGFHLSKETLGTK